MAKVLPTEFWDRIILFHSAQSENKAYAERLSAKAAALGSESEMWAEADKVVDRWWGRYPSEEPWEWEDALPGEADRCERAMREHREDVFLRLKETDSYTWGLAVAGVMHLWERSVRIAVRTYMKPVPTSLRSHDFKQLCKDVTATGYAVKEALEYPDLQRSVRIANATKHSDGPALNKLLATAPEMFVGGTDSEHLRVGIAEFDRAVAAVDAFWSAYEKAYDRWSAS